MAKQSQKTVKPNLDKEVKAGSKQQEAKAAVFNVKYHYVKDLSVECLLPAVKLEGKKPVVELDIGAAPRKLSDSEHEAGIFLKGTARDEKGATVYVVELEYVGGFEIDAVPESSVLPMLMVDGATLIYPFARQVFMNAVESAGYRSPMLDAVNFHALFVRTQQEMMNKQKNQATA